MPRRKLADYGLEQTRPHLFFTVADMDLLNRQAEQHNTTLSEWIERIVRAWCVERRALDRHLNDALKANDDTMAMMKDAGL